MSEYTPTVEQARAAYTRAMRNAFIASSGEHDEEFDRMIRIIKADAFSEGAAKQREIVEHKLGRGQTIVIPQNPYRIGGKNV